MRNIRDSGFISGGPGGFKTPFTGGMIALSPLAFSTSSSLTLALPVVTVAVNGMLAP